MKLKFENALEKRVNLYEKKLFEILIYINSLLRLYTDPVSNFLWFIRLCSRESNAHN